MKLPKALIKKYGISKKAWSVFRGKKTKNKEAKVMARKRSSRTSSKTSGFAKDAAVVGSGMLYGAAREWASQKVAPLTSKLPGGYLADNFVLGFAGYLLWKGKVPFVNKFGMSKEVGKAMVYVESALAGVDMKNRAKGMSQGQTTTVEQSSSVF